MKRPEIHVIHAERYPGAVLLRIDHPNHIALHVNALLSKAMIGRQLYLYGDDLT